MGERHLKTIMSKLAFIFPGQGSQYPGMAKDFYENYQIAKETFQEANDILGRNLLKIILEGPVDLLTETQNSQTGIFVASIAILRTLQQLFPDLKPSVCAGLSLGEYTALAASGKLDFANALQLVQKRGTFMNEACENNQGTMAVVLGLTADEVEKLVKEVNMPHDLWVANFNCPGQVVISGTLKGIEKGTFAAKEAGAKRVLPLQVHGAFHSGLMKSAEEKLAPYVQEAPLKESEVDLVMNVPGDFVKETDQIFSFLIQQVTHPVKWQQGIEAMASQNVQRMLEIGCGKTLTGFNKRIEGAPATLSIEKITDLEQLEKAWVS